MPLTLVFVLVAALGLGLVGAGVLALRAVGARPGVARRLAGPPEMKVGRLVAADRPDGTVRVAGRIRCRDPLEAGDGERLVAYHRDVEAHVGGRWRMVERIRETRSFELWDHEGSITVDPAQAAEPLIAIPKVWRGSAGELEEPHASVVARLAERHGPAEGARATTRSINVTDRLLLLAPPVSVDGRVRLTPPDGGYLLTNLALDDAMRLLGGRHRRIAASAVIGQAIGVALAAIGLVGVLVTRFAGG